MPDKRPGESPSDPPEYTRYRAGLDVGGWLRRRRGGGDREPASGGLEGLRRRAGRGGDGRGGGRAGWRGRRGPRSARGVDARRVAKWLVLAIVGWLALALVLFLVSAQVNEGSVPDSAKAQLDGGSFPPFSATTVLVLGSDQRTKGSKEPGAITSGPSRSDVMLLIRTGGGHSAKLSIPRDTVVDVPGHGIHKINAAYAFGGPALAIATVKAFLGISINHVVEVNFDNFPQLIDSMGGVDYTGGCVISRISGGSSNGGYTLRLKGGTTRINGKQALALARTRHNDCHPGESDIVRAQRQQKLFAAMKSRLVSVSSFFRLPLIAWNAPQALRSDMGGPTLLGLFSALAVSGTPSPRVMMPSGVAPADGGTGLTISDSEKRREVARFLAG
jgi:LCP family protein required for cell wall assembly